MMGLLLAALLLFVDQRPALPPPLPEWSVIQVWCKPVPEIGAPGAWVTFVVHDGRLHGGGGSMPLRWLNKMPWRNSDK